MRRLVGMLPPLLPLLLLAGCAGGAAAPPGSTALPGAPAAQLRVGFPPYGLADTIEVDAVERLPLRAAALVAPDGRATPASYIDVSDAPRLAAGQIPTGSSWQDAVSGSGSALAALTLSHAQAGAALQSEERLLAMVSTADIPLPDPVSYRRGWRQYHIRLTFGAPPGEVETRDIPAPAPPPPR